MKAKHLLFINLFLIFALFLSNTSAQDYIKWHLPEGARARFGKGCINGLTFSPDSRRLMVASDIGIWVYDVHTGKELDLLSGDMHSAGEIDSVFSLDGRILAVVGIGKEIVYLWDVENGQRLKTLTGHKSWVNSVCFSPDGTTLAGGGANGNIFLWDTSTGVLRKTPIIKHKDQVNSICFSPDGTVLASSEDLFEEENNTERFQGSVVHLWDVDTGQHLKSFRHEWWVFHLCFSPDGTILASSDGGSKGSVQLWSTVTGDHLRTLTGHEGGIRSLCFSPDGTTLISASADRTVRLWDPVTGHIRDTLASHTSAVRNICYSPDGSVLASRSSDEIIRLWSASTGHLKNTLTGHTGSVKSICFSPDGTTLASGSSEYNVRLWNTTTGSLQSIFTKFNSLCFSPDGTTFALANHSNSVGDGNVSLRVTATGQHLNTFTENKGWVNSVCFSPNGTLLAYGIVNNGSEWTDTRNQRDQYISVVLRSARTGQTVKTLAYSTDQSESWINSICFSPDGTTLASGGHDNNVHLWNAVTGVYKGALRGHKNFIWNVAFGPDSTILASRSADKTIRLWDTDTRQHLKTFIIGTANSGNVCFSHDGQMVVSSGDDGEVLLWSVSTGQLLKTFVGHSYVTNVCFSADGSTLASGGNDGTVLLWNIGVSTSQTPQEISQQETEETTRQADVLTTEQIAKIALASTVLIVMEDAKGKPINSGSGFFVGNGLIATNLHVVEKGTKGTFKQVGGNERYNIKDTIIVDKQRDLVILKVSEVGAPALSLGDSDKIQIGQSVYAVGNPKGFLEGTFAPGFVSSIRGKDPNKYIQITAPISQGSSGGPLFDNKGQVIGIVVGAIEDGQNLNFAIPSNYLSELLGKVRERR